MISQLQFGSSPMIPFSYAESPQRPVFACLGSSWQNARFLKEFLNEIDPYWECPMSTHFVTGPALEFLSVLHGGHEANHGGFHFRMRNRLSGPFSHSLQKTHNHCLCYTINTLSNSSITNWWIAVCYTIIAILHSEDNLRREKGRQGRFTGLKGPFHCTRNFPVHNFYGM